MTCSCAVDILLYRPTAGLSFQARKANFRSSPLSYTILYPVFLFDISLTFTGTVCSILEVEQAQAELHWDEAKAKMGISSHFSPSMFASKDTSSKP